MLRINKINNETLKIYLLFLFCFCFSLVGAQTVTGTITNRTTSEPIEDALVVAKNGDEMVSYTYTDVNGHYNLKINNFAEITLTASSLGFASKNLKIRFVESQVNHVSDFLLNEKTETLTTVVLKADEKIKINRDTISFRISAFKDASERTVEDMLKKLPGIEVDDDGNIRALGKPIQKILIEGDDLADSNYKVISKNLDITVLDKIEIINNYDENPVLKQFLSSENIVLNLKLKKDKKSVLFGKAEIGGGIENRFLGDVNLGVINPLVKLLNLANTNNTGSQAGKQFGVYTYSPIGFNDFTKDFSINQNPIVLLSGSTNELNTENYIENTSFSNNLLINKRFSDSIKLRNSLYYYNDSFEQYYKSEYQYFVEPKDIFFKEQNSFNQEKFNLSNDLKITFTPSKDRNITVANTLTFLNGTSKNSLLFNEENIQETLRNKTREQETQIQLTQKIKSGAVVIDFYVGSKKLDQIFQIFPNTFIADSINQNTLSYSDYNTTLDYQGLDASLVFKNNKTSYSFTGGFQHINETIKTKSYLGFQNQNEKIDSLSGRHTARSLLPHLQFKVEEELYQDVLLYANLDAIWNSYDKNNFSNNFFLPNPSAGLRIRKTKTGTYHFKYSYISEIPRLNYLTDNFMIKSYRNLSLGISKPEALKSHSYTFNYTFSKVEKRILFNVSATHRKFLNQVSFKNSLGQNTDITQSIFSPGQKLWLFQASFTSYIDPVNTSVKIGYQKQFSEQAVIINNKNTKLKNNTSQYYLSGTTYLKGVVNFKFLANYTINAGENGRNIIRNERYKFELKTIFNVNKVFIATLESKGYLVSSQFYETNNAEIEFRPKGKNWTLGLKIINIFNDKEYIFENSSDYVQTATVFEAVPRYGILYGRFRF